MSYESVTAHHAMVFDAHRNGLYAQAFRDLLPNGASVMDLGAGVGILGFLARQAGAGTLYLIEPSPVLHVAEQAARDMGMADVHCLQARVEDVQLEAQVDCLVSVFTGNLLFTEDLLPSLFRARERFLKPGGLMIPDRAVIRLLPISAPTFYANNVDCWRSGPWDLDLGAATPYAANSPFYLKSGEIDWTPLSEAADIHALDFTSAREARCDGSARVAVTRSGLCHGLLGWFDTRIGERWLSTAPDAEKTHWRQVFLPLESPLQLTAGEDVELALHRAELGEWTWRLATAAAQRRQSTFRSVPLTPRALARLSLQHRPTLARSGQQVQAVLGLLDGGHSTAEIIERLSAEHPELFAGDDLARRVRDIVRAHGH